MTVAIGFKGSEGVVLAADSRVTIQALLAVPNSSQQLVIPATYDNATKLLKVEGQDHVAAVTYDVGTIGVPLPRTAHSLLPEFEAQLSGQPRLSVKMFAEKLAEFFLDQWNKRGGPPGQAMRFIVGGYDEGDAYGKIFTVSVPTGTAPVEQQLNDFGITWGGQCEILSRILNGYDSPALTLLQKKLNLTDVSSLQKELSAVSGSQIPYQFLPLQDCIDLSILMIKTTTQVLNYAIGLRGVGGNVDVATITRGGGFSYVQRKEIRGERLQPGPGS